MTVEYGEAGQTRIDYKTYDLKKPSELAFTTNRNDAIKEIKIVRVPRRLIWPPLIDRLAAEADQLQDGDPRRAQFVDQIAALNAAITQHTGD